MNACRTLCTVVALLVACPLTLAIQPGQWVQTTESEFDGETQDTVVTNLGDIKLTAATEIIGEIPAQASIIYDIAAINGVTYLAAGPEAKLLRRDGDQIVQIIALEDEQVFALAEMEGKLLVAISGATSRLAVLEGDELSNVVVLDGVRYVWDLIINGSAVLVATGTNGKLLHIETAADEPVITEVFDAEQANILCLARRGTGPLHAGTDTDGLIYRFTESNDGTWQAFVVYDAAEPEIGALLITENGNLYAGTADANMARPGRLEKAVADDVGRPESDRDQAPTENKEAVDTQGVDAETPPENGQPEASQPKQMDESPANKEATAPVDAKPAEEADPELQSPNTLKPQTQIVDSETDPPADDGQGPPSAKPTPEQRDRLRQLVRARLLIARDSGKLQAASGMPTGSRQTTPGAARTRAGSIVAHSKKGNALYQIDTEGFIDEVLRESVMILNITETGSGQLLVATGNEGQIYHVAPDTGETTIIADLEPEQVPALWVEKDGSAMLGTANPAQLVRIGGDVATRGIYESSAMDAQQISLWGSMQVTATVPENTSVTIETRSGNVKDPENGPWSEWSKAQVIMTNPQRANLQPQAVQITAPPARFLQYRLTLIGDRKNTPVISRVTSAYVTPNLRPRIGSLKAAYPDPPQQQPGKEAPLPVTKMNIEWEATDPNGDNLRYTLEYQPAESSRWIEIAKDLEQSPYEWQTRRVPDGWYLLHVVADDKQDNPPDMAMTATRRSSPILVDNSAPRLETLKHIVEGRVLTLSGTAIDDWSPLQAIAYVIDGGDLYHPILPEDLIFDSTREPWLVKISGLEPGPHVVTLRVTDVRGNVSYKATTLEIVK